MTIDINATFQPRNDADFPVSEARYIKAVALTVPDLAARTALEAYPERLEVGQLVWVVDQAKLYSLDTGKLSWTEVVLGGGGGGGGNTLDGAYDQGGAGIGRTITADSNAVIITTAENDANNVLEVTKSPASGPQAGSGLVVTMGSNTNDSGVEIVQSGSGAALKATAGNVEVAAGDIAVGVTTGFLFPNERVRVGDAGGNAGIVVRDTANGIETEMWSGLEPIGSDPVGQIGTNSNHKFQIYTNQDVRWNITTAGDFEHERNSQSVKSSILDFSTEPEAPALNENVLIGGAGNGAAVSAANTGRIRYNQTAQKWEKSENGGAYELLSGGGDALNAPGGVVNQGVGTAFTVIADAASLVMDCALGNSFRFTFLANDRMLGAPVNPRVGQVINMEINQGANAPKLMTWDAIFLWPGATPPTLSVTVNAKDLISGWYDGTNWWMVWQGAFG